MTQNELILGKCCQIFVRNGRKNFYCSIKCPHQPRFIRSLQTTSAKEARLIAARLYWLSRPTRRSDVGPPDSLIFIWDYWKKHHPNHNRMKTIRFHMERKFIPLLGKDCSMESSPLLEKELTSYCKQREADGKSPNTIKLEVQSLLQSLRFARKRGIIETVPAIDVAEVELPSSPAFKPKKKPTLLSKKTIHSLPMLLKNWSNQPHQKPHHQYSRTQLRFAALLMVSTGVPPKTLKTMRNYCLEFSDDGLEVLIGFEKGEDKTRNHHRVRAQFQGDYKKPARWMKQWMKLKQGKQQDDLLFSNRKGASVGDQLSTLFSRFIRDNGIQPSSTEKRLTLFALRDVYLNNLHDRDLDIPTNYMKLNAGPEPEEYIDPHRNDVPPGIDVDQNHIPPHIRFASYKGDKAWQVLLKEESYESDLHAANLTPEEQSKLRTSDFAFSYVPATDKEQCNQVREFLKVYEWLGTIQVFTTHRFIWRLNLKNRPNILSGVLCFSSPNKAQDFLKDGSSQNLERLISRGATNAIAPKNMASHMISTAMKHMVKNSPYRLFTGYADPTANENGIVYRATSFMHLGSGYGSYYEYLTDKGWQGSKIFTERSSFVRYAKELGIEIKDEWFAVENGKRRLDWDVIPTRTAKKLRARAAEERSKYQRRKANPKSKYCFVLGRTHKETKRLRKAFVQANANLPLFEYPTEKRQ